MVSSLIHSLLYFEIVITAQVGGDTKQYIALAYCLTLTKKQQIDWSNWWQSWSVLGAVSTRQSTIMVCSLMHSLLFGTFHICGRQVPIPVLLVTLFVMVATSYTARALTVRRRQRRAAEKIYAQKRQKNLKAIQEVYDKLRYDKVCFFDSLLTSST